MEKEFSYHSKCNNDNIYRELLLSFTETLQGLREIDFLSKGINWVIKYPFAWSAITYKEAKYLLGGER